MIKEVKLRRITMIMLMAAVLFTAACSSPEKKAEAGKGDVKSAVEAYLTGTKGIELNNVDLGIANLKEEGDRMTCEVSVALKEDAKQKFTYNYTLKKENGKWKVASSEAVGGPHAGKPASQMPEGHPPVAEGQQPPPSSQTMPPGHPPVGDNPHAAPPPQIKPEEKK